METRGTHTSRAEWQKRIERWRDSGLSAEQFAAELGINFGTLKYWKYRLGKEAAGDAVAKSPPSRRSVPREASFIEVPTATVVASSLFVLELGNARRLHIPAQFETSVLERLLAVLERG